MNQKQLKEYKSDLEEIFFSGKYSGDVATMIRAEIIKVGKQITPEVIVQPKTELEKFLINQRFHQ